MWRAWGIILFALSQDAGKPYTNTEHGFSITPPVGWVRKAPAPPALVAFGPAEKTQAPCELEVKHLTSGNPKPIGLFSKEAREFISTRYKDAVIKEEKELTLGGRPAYRFVFTQGDRLEMKTVIHRSNVEFILADARMGKDEADRLRPQVEAAIESLRLQPVPLSAEQAALHGRTMETLRAAKVRPSLLVEQWFAIHLGRQKTGHQRLKLAEAGGKYLFETDVKSDYGDGGTDASVVRGEFSPDGAYQKVEFERTKTTKDNRWQVRASVVLKDGKATATRDMEGVKEEKSFAVDPGVLLTDVAEYVRPELALSGKGAYLLRTLSPFAEEPGVEVLEVNEKEPTEIDGRKEEAVVVFSTVDRRRPATYFFAAGGTLMRQGGVKDTFSIRAATKEQALKP